MKKVVGIVLVFFVLLGSSTIYASGLPRTSLSKWYDQSFQKESEKFKEATSIGVKEVLKEMNGFLTESKESFASIISDLLEGQVKEINSRIGARSNDIKIRIDETVTELEKVSFDEYVDKVEIEEDVRQDIEEILANVLSH
ncbi:hypothetical protein [Bacillus sp. FJAT-22090]|uniref:hypothetical protein n=1 Tax=Bacillus sp. FJAT-22090 TaxID=1581038 RepID=UPI0011A9D3B7|nr:hypothetical protein [Bacillus sp. FJAT-22090]